MDRMFLIGSRGSGKTTLARLLAKRLGWEWADADAAIEELQGRSIRAIFDAEGEAGFRELEAAVLAELCQRRRHVIATGGGVVLRPENRALLRGAGWCVWLTADVATLWQRLQDDPGTPERRPRLTVGGIEEIAGLLRQREALYRECAHVTVPTEDRPLEAIVAEILERRPTGDAPPGLHGRG
jgi:shikimate kinase